MKILRLLNRKNLPIIFFIILICFDAKTEDKPVDIWNIDKKEIEKKEIENTQNLNQNINNVSTQSSIYEMQSKKETEKIKLDNELDSSEIKIIGLYDPEKYDLDIFRAKFIKARCIYCKCF